MLEVPPDCPPRVRELRAAGDALVVALRNIGEPWVGSADDGVKDVLASLEPRAGLYARRADLEQLSREIDSTWEYELQRELSMFLDDEEPPPALDERTVRKLLHLDDTTATGRYPDGYFQSADGRTLVVAVRSKVLGSDFVQGTRDRVAPTRARWTAATASAATAVLRGLSTTRSSSRGGRPDLVERRRGRVVPCRACWYARCDARA